MNYVSDTNVKVHYVIMTFFIELVKLTNLQESLKEPLEYISQMTDLVIVKNSEDLEHLVNLHFVLLVTLATTIA